MAARLEELKRELLEIKKANPNIEAAKSIDALAQVITGKNGGV